MFITGGMTISTGGLMVTMGGITVEGGGLGVTQGLTGETLLLNTSTQYFYHIEKAIIQNIDEILCFSFIANLPSSFNLIGNEKHVIQA